MADDLLTSLRKEVRRDAEVVADKMRLKGLVSDCCCEKYKTEKELLLELLFPAKPKGFFQQECKYVDSLVRGDSDSTLKREAQKAIKYLKDNDEYLSEKDAARAVNLWFQVITLRNEDIVKVEKKIPVPVNNPTPKKKPVIRREKDNNHIGLILLLLCVAGFFGYRYLTMGKIAVNIPSGTIVVFEHDGTTVAKRKSLPCKISLKSGTHKIKIIAGDKYWIGNVDVKAREEIKPAASITEWQVASNKPMPKSAKSKKNKFQRKSITSKRAKEVEKNNSTKTESPKSTEKLPVITQQEAVNQENTAQQEAEAARRKREENLRRIQEAEQN